MATAWRDESGEIVGVMQMAYPSDFGDATLGTCFYSGSRCEIESRGGGGGGGTEQEAVGFGSGLFIESTPGSSSGSGGGVVNADGSEIDSDHRAWRQLGIGSIVDSAELDRIMLVVGASFALV